jgi:hypothetical protein
MKTRYEKQYCGPDPDPPGPEIICLSGAKSQNNVGSRSELFVKIIMCPSLQLNSAPIIYFCINSFCKKINLKIIIGTFRDKEKGKVKFKNVYLTNKTDPDPKLTEVGPGSEKKNNGSTSLMKREKFQEKTVGGRKGENWLRYGVPER